MNTCQLYTILRTDLHTWEVTEVPGVRGDFDTVSRLTRETQDVFDPDYEFYDYRVGMCS